MSEWRRFERTDRHSGRFWAIRVVGRACELRFGPIGAGEVTTERLEHASESEAAHAARQKIRAKQLAGWVEVPVEQADDAREQAREQGAALEQAIAKDLSNLDNWAVYADWLQPIEPLLGERVALGLALARVGSKAARTQLEARIAELERVHGRALFGVTLAGVLGERRFERVVELERTYGMIVGATLRDPEDGIIKFDALVAALLDLPLARLLLALRIETAFRRRSLARAAELFVTRRHPHLRRLSLGEMPDHGGTNDVDVPPLAAVLGCAPNLERAELFGNFNGDARHEILRELKLHRHGGMSLPLQRWQLPGLQRLHLIEPGPVDWQLVSFPQLERLLIEWRDCGDRLVARLAQAPLLDQLDTLVLTRTHLTADGVRTLLEHAERFASIRQLALLDVDTEERHIAPLLERLPNALVMHRHGWGEWDDWDEDWPDSPRDRRRELTRF